jgi:uncharacterized membrane protein
MESQRRTATWIFVALIVGLAALVALLFASGRVFSAPPFYYFGWWWIPLLFFFGFFFLFLWWCWGWWRGSGYYYDHPALETLRQRFARGEITNEQYDEMRRNLEATG